MPETFDEPRYAARAQQAASRLAGRHLPMVWLVLLAGCGGGNPLDTPIGWFHDLQGGAIAAQRPPPPGVGLPYPKLVSVPAAPSLPDPAFRDSLREQLLAQRDRAERVAARSPVAPPALDSKPRQAAGAPPNAPPPDAGVVPAAQASLPMAEPAPAAIRSAGAGGPPADAPVILVGSLPQDTAGTGIPAAPPPPATFEGVPAEPLPTPQPPVPPHLPQALRGTDILFLPGEAILRQSQLPTLRDIAATRKQRRLTITGLGEAVSDSPDGQAAAIELGLKRAQAVAEAFAALHVPDDALVLSAYAFGRGATVRLGP